jgi:hypothetical protein
VLNGNHETMNVAQDMRYGTKGASEGLQRMADAQAMGAGMKRKCKCAAGWTEVPAHPAPSAPLLLDDPGCGASMWSSSMQPCKRVKQQLQRFINLRCV